MERKIKTIDMNIYSEPDDKGRVKAVDTKNAQKVFDELQAHLQKYDMLPDEYFLLSSSMSETTKIPEDADFICHTNYGCEGVYVDITYLDDDNRLQRFATGKTLSDDGNAFLKMSRMATECNMMLNGYGNEVTYDVEKDLPQNVFKLNETEKTTYTLLETEGEYSLLKREIKDGKIKDPTPYIVASGVCTDGDKISWNHGNYCSDLRKALNVFNEKTNFTEKTSIIEQLSDKPVKHNEMEL